MWFQQPNYWCGDCRPAAPVATPMQNVFNMVETAIHLREHNLDLRQRFDGEFAANVKKSVLPILLSFVVHYLYSASIVDRTLGTFITKYTLIPTYTFPCRWGNFLGMRGLTLKKYGVVHSYIKHFVRSVSL